MDAASRKIVRDGNSETWKLWWRALNVKCSPVTSNEMMPHSKIFAAGNFTKSFSSQTLHLAPRTSFFIIRIEREKKKESERWKCFSRIVWHILITISIRHIQHTELLYDEYILNLPNSSHKTILKMNRCGNLIQFWNILQWMPFQSTVWG